MELPINIKSYAQKGIFCVIVICLPALLWISYHSGYRWEIKSQSWLSETPRSPSVEDIHYGFVTRQNIPKQNGEPLDQETINSERVKTMDDYCNTLDQETLRSYVHRKVPRYYHVLVDDKRKFMFCTIAKVACSNWKRLFIGLSGVKDPFGRGSVDVRGNKDLKAMSLSTYSPEEIAYRLKHYTKAILVRDPLERVLSAYRNKFFDKTGETIFKHIYRPMILRKYRPDLNMRDIAKGARVSLQEFVRYLTHPSDFPQMEPNDHMNVHWEPFITSCDPCSVRYDIIAKYETLEEDVSFILNKISASDLITWPKRSEHYKKTPTAQLVEEAYKNISSRDLRALTDIYYQDYRIFGYQIPQTET